LAMYGQSRSFDSFCLAARGVRLASSPSAASCRITCPRVMPLVSAIASYRSVSCFDSDRTAPNWSRASSSVEEREVVFLYALS